MRGLLSEVTVTQTYENLEETNIEAVYTLPLSLDVVLMELTLELNGEILRGEVKPKNEAEADYEDAIEEGDSAVLLTQVQPGLFSVNVGNLMAGEKAKLRFAMPNCTAGRTIVYAFICRRPWRRAMGIRR